MDYKTNDSNIVTDADYQSDKEHLMRFMTQLDTVILTHHDMPQELYKPLNELKVYSKDLYELLSGEKAKKYNAGMARLNVYYYDEYIKILKNYFDTPANAQNIKIILKVTAKMKELVIAKQKEFVGFANTAMKSDIEFFLEQINSDIEG